MNKKNKIIAGIICLITLITFGGMTSAYFSRGEAEGQEDEKVVTLTADYGEIIVRYPEDNKISMSNVDLKESESGSTYSSLLKLDIENTGNIEQNVTIKWKDVINDFCQYQSNNSCTNIETDEYVGDEVNYKIYRCESEEAYQSGEVESCSIIGSGRAPISGDTEKTHDEESISLPAESQTYYLLSMNIENKNIPQDYNQGKSFNGTIDVQLYEEETYEIEGIVKEEGIVLSSAIVRLYSDPKETTTDEKGYYKIEGIKEGDHTLEIEYNDEITSKRLRIVPSDSDSIRQIGDIIELRIKSSGKIVIDINGSTLEVEDPTHYKIAIEVENGVSEKEEIEYIFNAEPVKITANENYDLTSATVKCDEGIEGNVLDGTLSITSAINDGSCLVTIPIMHYAFTASSNNTSYGTVAVQTPSVSHGETGKLTVTNVNGIYRSVSCSGTHGTPTISGTTISVPTIQSAVHCTANFYPKVTISVTGGSVGSSTIYYQGSTGTTITPSSGYTVKSASVSCTTGITASVSGSTLTISGATQNGTCTLTLKPYAYKQVMNTASSVTTSSQVSYRYRGASANNYVTFNGQSWRIVGAFQYVTNRTSTEWRVKLVKATHATAAYWHTTSASGGGSNNWVNSSLNSYLNNTYYPSLTQTAKNLISTKSYWYLGKISHNLSAAELYAAERSTTSYVGYYQVANYVGLLYASDWAYASTNAQCVANSGGEAADCKYDNWLLYNVGNGEWGLNPCSETQKDGTTNGAVRLTAAGTAFCNVYAAVNYVQDYVRPVVYLDTGVYITGGSGTSSSPWTLSE